MYISYNDLYEKVLKRVSLKTKLFCNYILKLTSPFTRTLLHINSILMTHFHYHTTFEVLPSIVILTYSWIKDKIFYMHNWWNCTINSDSTLLFPFPLFLQLHCSLTDQVLLSCILTQKCKGPPPLFCVCVCEF